MHFITSLKLYFAIYIQSNFKIIFNAFQPVPQIVFNNVYFKSDFKVIFGKGNTHRKITLQKKKRIVAMTYLLREGVIMTVRNCVEKSERGEMVCSESENSEGDNASGEIEKKGFQ